MKSIDGILPEPKTELEAWYRWKNRLASEFISRVGKKIRVHVYADNLSELDNKVLIDPTTPHDCWDCGRKTNYFYTCEACEALAERF